MTRLVSGSRTDTGKVRVANQDNLIIAAPLFAVADGMGGHAGGEVASRLAVEALADSQPRTLAELTEAVRHANRVIFDQADSHPDLHGMGTTLCALALVRVDTTESLVVVNVGDSRVYVMQDGRLLQITRDHKFVEDLIAAGELTVEEARHHPRRNIVTRALGIDADVDVDTWEVTPFVGDRYLLCSDGLTDELEDDAIAVILRSVPDPQAAANQLLDRAMVAGARDNVTVIVVDVVDDDPLVVSALDADLGGWLGTGAPPPPDEIADEQPDPPAPDEPVGGWLHADATTFPSTPAPVVVRPPVEEPEPAAPAPRRTPVVTWRSVTFVTMVLLTFAVAFAATASYARAGYTVVAKGPDIIIEKGRPGGLLWFHNTYVQQAGVRVIDLPPDEQPKLAAGLHFGSLTKAQDYLRARQAQRQAQLNLATTTTTSPTTTVPPSTVPATTTLTTAAPTTAPQPTTAPTTLASTTTVK
jgi:protein phosphatase